jgi:hypothetical protein
MVTVESGGLLQAMERRGLAFSRFLRALRMGLGNRYQDPRVNEALALFKGGFRHKDPEALLEVARALKRIFGGECALLECKRRGRRGLRSAPARGGGREQRRRRAVACGPGGPTEQGASARWSARWSGARCRGDARVHQRLRESL